MSDLLANLREFGQRHGAFAGGHQLVVGVSGGPDSLALLHGLVRLRSACGFGLVVAHLNHGLRGGEATREAGFVAETARLWDVPCVVAQSDVGELARIHGLNLYAAGRAARYALFAQIAREYGAHAVAVAHTADDQAETLLMHLIRGAGPSGLRGMRPLVAWEEWQQFGMPVAEPGLAPDPAPWLLRPLLTTPRSVVEAYCTAQNLQPCYDPANADTQHLRSHIRHILLPQLIEYNSNIVAALGRTAELLAQQEQFIGELLDQYWADLVQYSDTTVTFDGTVWHQLHPVLQAAALRRAYAWVGGSDTLALTDLERARAATTLRVGKRVELPGGVTVRVVRGGFLVGPTKI